MNIRAAITPQSGLGVLCALLLAASLFATWAPLPVVTASEYSDSPHAIERPLPTAFIPPPQSAFDAINERPIFSPERKPFAPDTVAGPSAAATPPSVALVGVILDGTTGMALIRSAASPLETAFSVGQTIEGWAVSEIDADKIVLTSGGARDEIKLEANKAAKSANAISTAGPRSQPRALSQQQTGPVVPAAAGQQPRITGGAAQSQASSR